MDKMEKKKGLLVVSFGTSVNETCKKTIDVIEKRLQEEFSEYVVYRAWTSKKIIKKIRERDGVKTDTVAEAMERMFCDGIEDIVVQPTHVIDGIENEQMTEDVLAYRERFASLRFGKPLLVDKKDLEGVTEAVMEEFGDLSKDEALVFMGHGTVHKAHRIYQVLDAEFKNSGYPYVFLGTVEASPSLERLIERVRAYGVKKVRLAPFMVVAGDHALHDMSGDSKKSWKNLFEAAGFEVRCVLKGLGEYRGIQRLYVQHVKEALRKC